MPIVGFVHSTRIVIEPVHQAIMAACPDIDPLHVLDEGLLRQLKGDGGITPQITEWMTDMTKSVERQGAELAVVTCSSLSPCVNDIRKAVRIPVLKIDEPMVEWAIRNAATIGLVMTNPTTEVPSRLLIDDVSQRLGKTVEIRSHLCSEAFWKLNAGDIKGHDNEVVKAVHGLLREVDVVILAQISIARVLEKLESNVVPKVLSSLRFLGTAVRATIQDKKGGMQ